MLRGIKLFVENKSYIYNFATETIEQRTAPSGEYRRGIASAHQISAAGGLNSTLIDGGRPRADSQLLIKSATSIQSFGSAFSDHVQLQNVIEVHKTPISVTAPKVKRSAPRRGNSEIISPNECARNTTHPPCLRDRAAINERQIVPRKLSFQDQSDWPQD